MCSGEQGQRHNVVVSRRMPNELFWETAKWLRVENYLQSLNENGGTILFLGGTFGAYLRQHFHNLFRIPENLLKMQSHKCIKCNEVCIGVEACRNHLINCSHNKPLIDYWLETLFTEIVEDEDSFPSPPPPFVAPKTTTGLPTFAEPQRQSTFAVHQERSSLPAQCALKAPPGLHTFVVHQERTSLSNQSALKAPPGLHTFAEAPRFAKLSTISKEIPDRIVKIAQARGMVQSVADSTYATIDSTVQSTSAGPSNITSPFPLKPKAPIEPPPPPPLNPTVNAKTSGAKAKKDKLKPKVREPWNF